jgi:F0F1-type ATP synthase delta subunit
VTFFKFDRILIFIGWTSFIVFLNGSMTNLTEILGKVNALLIENKNNIEEAKTKSNEDAQTLTESFLKKFFEGTLEEFLELIVDNSHDETSKNLIDEWISLTVLSKR